MEKLIEKISGYNLLNNIVPGSIFCYIMENLLGVSILKNDIILNLFLFYFTGMISSRIGSIIIEEPLKYFEFIKFEPYDQFISASQKDQKIEIMSETNNTYRSISGMCIILLICNIYIIISKKISCLNSYTSIIIIISVFILFIISYKKQTKCLTNRIKIINKL